jgi:hypothetical protein
MTDIRQEYISLIQKRSTENEKALQLLFSQNLFGNCLSTLRQELDSFIRIMYLGRISDINERERLMQLTLSGKRWKVLTGNNKFRPVTDKEMEEKASELHGYIHYVYKFGCSFIHLSDFHNYENENPFDKLDEVEQFDISFYLKQYHGVPLETELTVDNISILLPAIFKKISANMTYYFGAILNDGMIDS